GLVSPFLTMSAPSALSSFGDMRGKSSAAGWIGSVSRQGACSTWEVDLEAGTLVLPNEVFWPSFHVCALTGAGAFRCATDHPTSRAMNCRTARREPSQNLPTLRPGTAPVTSR